MTARLRYVLALVVCMAFLAAACGGEVTESEGDDDGAAAPTTQAPEPEATTTTTEPEEPEGPPPNIFNDPRDGIFDEYQASMDRGDHPFMQVDEFCQAHETAPNRVSTDAGIDADSISLVHMRAQLENLARIGFATDVGDPKEMFETFASVVNEQCGGVRGRMLVMHTLEHDPVSPDVDNDQNADCIEAIEDLHGVILLNSSGFQGVATHCIVADHETAFLTVQPQPEEFIRGGEGRLVITTLTAEQSLSWLARDLIARGDLDGKTVGVAAPDVPGQHEAVQAGLVDALRDNGVNVAVFDTIGCAGRICIEGVRDSVRNMREAGIDVFFNVLNTLSAPGYIAEMVNQGFQPGDVQFYASDFNSQAAELVASKTVQFGGEAAGALYNGAIILDARDTGSYRTEGYEPRAFNEMCNDTYGANSPSGTNHESEDRHDGNSRYGMVSSVCTVMRIALRAIYDAGDNPTRADIYAALANLGPVDTNEMIPGSIYPGKPSIPDAIHNLVFEFPCTKPYGFGDENVCLYPSNEYRPGPS